MHFIINNKIYLTFCEFNDLATYIIFRINEDPKNQKNTRKQTRINLRETASHQMNEPEQKKRTLDT